MRSKQALLKTSGQALVEFVILLIIISAICLGMLYSSRLLTFDYWAQQEARYIAFEEEWVAKEGGTDAQNQLLNSLYFHRPAEISQLPAVKDTEDDGGLVQLLASHRSVPAPANSGARSVQPTMFAGLQKGAAVWSSRSKNLIPPNTRLGEYLVSSAYATQQRFPYRSQQLIQGDPPPPPRPNSLQPYVQGNKLELYVNRMLSRGEVGVQICQLQNGLLRKAGIPQAGGSLQRCAARVDQGLAEELVRSTSIREVYRQIGQSIDDGSGPERALAQALGEATAEGFYSFFDSEVRQAANNAPGEISSSWVDVGLTVASNSEIIRVLTEMRYLGSNIAVGSVLAGVAAVMSQNTSSWNAANEKEFEDDLREPLFLDALDPINIGIGGYTLGVSYLPIPPFIDDMFSMMFEGVMRNVLNEEDGLVGTLIDDSNKLIEVSFDARSGLQLPVVRKFGNAANMTVRSRFYLVTQPWHIHRREPGAGSYRGKGGQADGSDMETEEAVLRRRTFGLWLFPAQPGQLLSPILGVLSDEMDLSGALTAFQGFESFIGDIKSFIFNDNPLRLIGEAMEDVPILGDLDVTLPEWPSVRPDAYPRSVEMTGDKLYCPESDPSSCSARNFQDYVTEQRDNNPVPDPEFGD